DTNANDASGNMRNGTINGTPTFATGATIGGNISFAATPAGSYVSMPGGILQTTRDVTLAAWVRVRTNQGWARIFDFGTPVDGSATMINMFLTPRTGTAPNILRFAISVGGGNMEQRLNATAAIPLNTWTHVAVVLGPNGGELFVGGVSVATNTALTLRPADL